MNIEHEIDFFEAKFENIRILANHFQIIKSYETLGEMFTEKIPFSQVWADMSLNGQPENKNLTGVFTLILKNQGKDQKTALIINSHITILASADTGSADNFCKLVQYFFDWIKKYVEENEIKDRNNCRFIVPDFLYSSENFRLTFPE